MTDITEIPQFGLLDGLQRLETIKDFLENHRSFSIEYEELKKDDLTREQKKEIIRRIVCS